MIQLDKRQLAPKLDLDKDKKFLVDIKDSLKQLESVTDWTDETIWKAIDILKWYSDAVNNTELILSSLLLWWKGSEKKSPLEIITLLLKTITDLKKENTTILTKLKISQVKIKSHSSEIREYRKKIYIDTLTWVKNRLKYNEILLEKLEEYNSTQQLFNLAILDIDFFKKFNDDYWHDVWDDVLKFFATKLKLGLWDNNIFRIGGEEFIYLSDLWEDIKKSNQKLEELRKDIEKTEFKIRWTWNFSKITFSSWLTKVNNGDSIETIFKRADENLYISKTEWRNRITVG